MATKKVSCEWPTETLKKEEELNGKDIIKTRRKSVQNQEQVSDVKGLQEANQLTNTKGKDTQITVSPKQENRMRGVSAAYPISVSEQQFITVKEETLISLNLLNSSANALLGAMNKMIPPEDSPRALGDYTAHGIRKISKSICDIIQTKNSVIRQIHSIARDEQ